jgi:hypothetical protein
MFVCVSAMVSQIVGVAITVAGCLNVRVDAADPYSLYMIAPNRHYCRDTAQRNYYAPTKQERGAGIHLAAKVHA